MKPLSASYLARRLLNTEIAWPRPHREEPGFALIGMPQRLENLLPQPLASASQASGDDFARLTRTLTTLKATEQVDRSVLASGEAMLPPLIERARKREEGLKAAADPEHPMMDLLLGQDDPPYLQTSDPLYQYHAARSTRLALETLHDGLAAISRALEQGPPQAARQGRS